MQGWKGGGKGDGNGKGGEYYPNLDEKHFRRVDKFKGDKDKYKSWMYEVLTAIGVVDTRLQKELKVLMKGFREQEKGFGDFDVDEDEVDKNRYEHYKGQLYGILVSLTEGGTEARAVLKGFEDRGEELDGYVGLLALQERFDVQTTSSMLGMFLEVVKPGGIKGDKDMIGKISNWETLVGALENRFGEVITENLKTALLIGRLPKEYHDNTLFYYQVMVLLREHANENGRL
jgi:hypothetical protein